VRARRTQRRGCRAADAATATATATADAADAAAAAGPGRVGAARGAQVEGGDASE